MANGIYLLSRSVYMNTFPRLNQTKQIRRKFLRKQTIKWAIWTWTRTLKATQCKEFVCRVHSKYKHAKLWCNLMNPNRRWYFSLLLATILTVRDKVEITSL